MIRSGQTAAGDSWSTDAWIFGKGGIFEGWFDPCPLDEDPKFDGLIEEWHHRTFVNPPYSDVLPWVDRAIYYNRKYDYSIALLLKHDSSTEWYRRLHEAGGKMLMINKRLKHGSKTAAGFPSVLVYLHGHGDVITQKELVD